MKTAYEMDSITRVATVLAAALLGDLNVFAAHLIDAGNSALSVCIGPQITMPTPIEDALGSRNSQDSIGLNAQFK
jgi:hypothetical protein